MLQNNKGSIMIVTLIIFSIISTICITCISLTYSNINIASLELKNLQLKENALGAVEIVYGNIKNEIDNAIDSCSNSQEYISYIKRDNYKSFILNCKDISKSDLDNTTVELTNKTPFGEVKNFEFEMKVFAKENNYKKQVQVFEGVVLKRQGGGARETFTVRKISFNVGVERTFPVHSPKLEKIEVTRKGKVRRAKLTYLRGRVGKAAKIKEAR